MRALQSRMRLETLSLLSHPRRDSYAEYVEQQSIPLRDEVWRPLLKPSPVAGEPPITPSLVSDPMWGIIDVGIEAFNSEAFYLHHGRNHASLRRVEVGRRRARSVT